ncbi:MAG: ABC transporter ATP-binding protein [Candidatus Rokubacteria bacterium 13_1_40CM_2_68_8]|nr:MAG: ABC transporter ATP-binding protein [Candidatus Rokubacteria bacterium 13_1_40CM_2_68_8]PYN21227.1 MAG: ABC transporter ATP-binding protein [Candidatus Rokubacteria bacterium]
MTSAPTLLEVQDLHVSYGRIRAVQGVSLSVPDAAVVALIGANGAGKSTLLRAISGIVRPRRGAVRFLGEDLVGLPVHQIVRRRVVHVPEGRGILARMTVLENLRLGGFARRDQANLALELDRVVTLFPLLRERRGQLAGSLSGGEQQMLAIARAMMARPRLLMLDEPSLGLAPLVVREIFRIIQRLTAEGTAVLLVEQNARMALQCAAHAYVLQTGCVVLSGRAADLLAAPEVQRAYLGAG